MRIESKIIYFIQEHPNKELCFNWIRENWHDMNSHSVHEFIESIKALSNAIGGDCDYCVSSSPDQGEFITFSDYDKDLLNQLDYDNLELTGVYWDYEIIKALKAGNASQALKALHSDTEYCYSNTGLYETCEAHDYEFYDNGSIA
jgi:hypothetical protein